MHVYELGLYDELCKFDFMASGTVLFIIHLLLQISPEKFSLVKNGDTENGDKSTSEVDVSDEIEVEKLIEKEILQDVVETRRIPQVKAMYVYKGQGMKIDKGEVR